MYTCIYIGVYPLPLPYRPEVITIIKQYAICAFIAAA